MGWVWFDTGTPSAAIKGNHGQAREPALVAGQRTAAEPRVKPNPQRRGSQFGLGGGSPQRRLPCSPITCAARQPNPAHQPDRPLNLVRAPFDTPGPQTI